MLRNVVINIFEDYLPLWEIQFLLHTVELVDEDLLFLLCAAEFG